MFLYKKLVENLRSSDIKNIKTREKLTNYNKNYFLSFRFILSTSIKTI